MEDIEEKMAKAFFKASLEVFLSRIKLRSVRDSWRRRIHRRRAKREFIEKGTVLKDDIFEVARSKDALMTRDELERRQLESTKNQFLRTMSELIEIIEEGSNLLRKITTNDQTYCSPMSGVQRRLAALMKNFGTCNDFSELSEKLFPIMQKVQSVFKKFYDNVQVNEEKHNHSLYQFEQRYNTVVVSQLQPFFSTILRNQGEKAWDLCYFPLGSTLVIPDKSDE